MIAKILKATDNFSGILYSELKIDEGKALFCGAYNFPFDENVASAEDYINYLERYAATATRDIKNVQFHAVISTKGKEHDKEFLTEITTKWMEKMGYGKQPYLIYFHGDTDNNHVHVVSCRINEKGERINPYMEGRRAGIAIRELMNENLTEKAKSDITDVINNYNFSTTAQFRLAIERRGWKTTEKDEKINLIKFVKQGDISAVSVSEKTQNYKPNEARIKQLRAIINKYKGLPTEQLQNFMRDSFGVDIVFHTAKNHTQPYGYTIIDNKAKQIFKGSEIIPIQAILNFVSREELTKLASEILNNYISNKKALYSELKNELSRCGYKIEKNNIFIKGDGTPLLRLSDEFYKLLRYNDRLKQANCFIATNTNEAEALSRIFFVRMQDIQVKPDFIRNDTDLREIVSFLSKNKEALKQWLSDNKFVLVSLTNNTYIIDTVNKKLADVSGLGIDNGLDIERYYKSYENNYDSIPENSFIGMLQGLFIAISAGISAMGGEEQDELEIARKKRKKRKMLL